jgi:hypothetical protein
MQGWLRIVVHQQDHDCAYNVPWCIKFLEFMFMNDVNAIHSAETFMIHS